MTVRITLAGVSVAALTGPLADQVPRAVAAALAAAPARPRGFGEQRTVVISRQDAETVAELLDEYAAEQAAAGHRGGPLWRDIERLLEAARADLLF
ncbi:MAG TPA: hypothetical protein VGD03_04865 [Frankiaceae bacterium]|nr:hypothetical protein [Mycobacterium sp.]